MTPVRDAMIVAGGAGTRLWPLTADRPKPDRVRGTFLVLNGDILTRWGDGAVGHPAVGGRACRRRAPPARKMMPVLWYNPGTAGATVIANRP